MEAAVSVIYRKYGLGRASAHGGLSTITGDCHYAKSMLRALAAQCNSETNHRPLFVAGSRYLMGNRRNVRETCLRQPEADSDKIETIIEINEIHRVMIAWNIISYLLRLKLSADNELITSAKSSCAWEKWGSNTQEINKNDLSPYNFSK